MCGEEGKYTARDRIAKVRERVCVWGGEKR